MKKLQSDEESLLKTDKTAVISSFSALQICIRFGREMEVVPCSILDNVPWLMK